MWAGWMGSLANAARYFCNTWHITSAISFYPQALDITLSPHPATQSPAASLGLLLRRSLVNSAGHISKYASEICWRGGYVLIMTDHEHPALLGCV